MSIKLMQAVWDKGPDTPTARLVLLALADYANDNGRGVYPSFQTIAEKCAIERRTAIRTVQKLLDEGYLTRHRRKANGEFTSSEYSIVVERLGLPAPTKAAKAKAPAAAPEVTTRSDTMSLPSDIESLRIDTIETPPSDTESPGYDTVSPPQWHTITTGSDTMSPNPSVLTTNEPSHDPSVGERSRARATAAPPPPPEPAFVPVSENLKRQKARAGIQEPPPTVAPASPRAVQLLAQLTSYQPGADVEAYLAGRLGESPDETALRRAVELWRASGYRPNNFQGMCDWYDELRRDPTWTPGKKFSSNGTGPNGSLAEKKMANSQAAIAAVMQEFTGS